MILNVIFSIHVFDLIYVMTGGGPGFSTTVLVQYIYQAAFENLADGIRERDGSRALPTVADLHRVPVVVHGQSEGVQ